MKMTPWGCCVLVYVRSGEPVVQSNKPGLPRTDVSGCEFEVGAPTSEEEVAKKKCQTKRVPKSPLIAVLESWLLSNLLCRFLLILFAHFLSLFRWCRNDSGVSGNEDVSTGVETDEQLRGRHIFVTRSLVPLAGGPSMMSLRLSTVEVGAGSCWSRHLMTELFVFKWGIY